MVLMTSCACRTNLREEDVQPVKEQLAQSLFDHIPVGVGSKGIIPMGARWGGTYSIYTLGIHPARTLQGP